MLFAQSLLCQTEDILSIFVIVSVGWHVEKLLSCTSRFRGSFYSQNCEAVIPIYRKIDRDYLSFATIVSLLTVA